MRRKDQEEQTGGEKQTRLSLSEERIAQPELVGPQRPFAVPENPPEAVGEIRVVLLEEVADEEESLERCGLREEDEQQGQQAEKSRQLGAKSAAVRGHQAYTSFRRSPGVRTETNESRKLRLRPACDESVEGPGRAA